MAATDTAPQLQEQECCPLCGEEAAFRTAKGTAGPLIGVECRRCGRYRISGEDAVALAGARAGNAAGPSSFPSDGLHAVSGYIREMTIHGHGDVWLRPESVAAMLAAAPRAVPARADRLLLNLAALSRFAGQPLDLDYSVDHVLSYSVHGGETAFLMDHLIASGLVDREGGSHSTVTVSVNGWGRVETLHSPGRAHNQAFVAMSFEDDVLPVYDSAIAPAIREAGFDPFVIAEHEHTGQIDDQILLELNRSRFVIADFTGHRPNVYFEAGYALGRGLPVIWTCRADDMDEAHFDTRQYNHLLWRTPEELREKLYRRIEVVVG